MNRDSGISLMRGVLLVLPLLLAGCGEKENAASKAAAQQQAEAPAVAAGNGHAHDGHPTTQTGHGANHALGHGSAAAADHSSQHSSDPSSTHGAHGATSTGDAMDHSQHGAPGAAHANTHPRPVAGAAMDHSAHAAAGEVAGTADHSAMGHTTRAPNAHAGHAAPTGERQGASASGTSARAEHSTPASGDLAYDPHAGMQHAAPSTAADPHAQHASRAATATTSAHAQHRATGMPPSVVAPAPQSSGAMQRLQPGETLRGDAFDAPAALSVAEAAKASESGGHEGHTMRGITPGEDRENPPTPMPATRDGRTTTVDHGSHDHGSHDHGSHDKASHDATEAPQATPDAAAIYACPMHPEVTSERPGTCPKCGMALVKKNG